MIDTNRFELGDKIHIHIFGTDYTATAVKKKDDCMQFVFDQSIEYIISLREIYQAFPDEIKDVLVSFGNGAKIQVVGRYNGFGGYYPVFQLENSDDKDREKLGVMTSVASGIFSNGCIKSELIERNRTIGLSGVYNMGLSDMYDYLMGDEQE